MARSPYGGGGWLGDVGDFLTEGLPPVGEAVERIEADLLLTGHPQAPDRPEGSAGWGSGHEEERQRGPALTFRRKANRVDVRIVSELSDYDALGPDETPEVFATAAREVVTAIAGLDRRVKRGDDLDLPRLLAHLNARLEQLPGTPEELTATMTELRDRAQARWAAMAPWEVVDVDWSLYAPEARALLDDPFYWDPADDEAPHGNDTGADLLATYLDQRPIDILDFVEREAVESGFASLAELAEEDEYEHGFLVVAAAFAELKVTGGLTPGIRDLALRAVERRDPDLSAASTQLLRSALR